MQVVHGGGFLPMGPFLVTSDEVGDPQTVPIQTEVNGEVVQDSSTAEMVFGVAELVSIVSQTITLEAGDCIATGTPVLPVTVASCADIA